MKPNLYFTQDALLVMNTLLWIGAIKHNTSNLELWKGNTKVGKQGVRSLYLFEITK